MPGSAARLFPAAPEQWRRQWRLVLLLKVVVAAIAVPLVLAVEPDPDVRLQFAVIVACVYLPLCAGLCLLQQRFPVPPNPVWMAVTLVDIAMVCMAQALFPQLQVAFLGLTVIVILTAVLIGVRWGLPVAAASWLGLIAAAVWGRGDQPMAFPVVLAGLLLIGMTVLLGSLSDELRRSVARAGHLADAVESLASAGGPDELLARLSAHAREGLGGKFAVVLLLDGEELRIAGGDRVPETFPAGAQILEQILNEPAMADAPTVRAITGGAPAPVRDLRSDQSMSAWLPIAGSIGFRSMVAVPIPGERGARGVLNVYLTKPHAFSRGETDFLVALAEHASTAIERAELRRREQEAAESLRDLDAAKSRFVATVSHELRTPLTAIVGFALTLRSQWATMQPEVRDDCLDRLSDNARSLEHLVTHLLDFGRVERGEFAIELRPMDAGKLVRSRIHNMESELRDHPVRVVVPDGLMVRTDPFAFERILGNLLSNAAKFSPAGSEVVVEVELAGDEVAVSVRDHGAGIPSGEIDRVFDVFYRGSAPGTRGTGIGLAVVRDLVELHGGRVTLRNAHPGSEFTVYLPAAGDADEAEAGAAAGVRDDAD